MLAKLFASALALSCTILIVITVNYNKDVLLRHNRNKRSTKGEENILLSSFCPVLPEFDETEKTFYDRKKRSTIVETQRFITDDNAEVTEDLIGYSGDEYSIEFSGDDDEVTTISPENLDRINLDEIRHYSNNDLLKLLRNVSDVCGKVTRLYSIGKTVNGNDIWAIEFTNNPGRHKILKPEFRYIANIHGNEITGRGLTIQLIKHLCVGYLQNDPDIRRLLKTTRIHVLPAMNPDGYDIAQTYAKWKHWTIGRYNWNGMDLNRNFPDLNEAVLPFANLRKQKNELIEALHRSRGKKKAILASHFSEVNLKNDETWGYNFGCARSTYERFRKSGLQSETKAVVEWMSSIPFVLSVSFHDGGVGAFYPFDKAIPGQWEAQTPDNELLRHLATTYAKNHKDMSDASKAYTDPWCRYKGGDYRRQGGVSNGAAWFGITGSMEDYSYTATNTFGIVVELSCEKMITEYKLEDEWNKNKDAMMKYIEQSHIGIKGIVRDRKSGEPLEGAVVHVYGIYKDVVTTQYGEYWRPLLPGQYKVQARYGNEISTTKEVFVSNKEKSTADIIDFDLF